MKLSPEEKQQRKIAREESKRLEEHRKEEALKLEMEEFFKEFPWRILKLLKTAGELSIDYSIKELTDTGETIIRFESPSTGAIGAIRFHPHEQSTHPAVYNDLVWELDNLEFLFNSVREKRDEEERRQKLRQEALSKLSPEERAVLEL